MLARIITLHKLCIIENAPILVKIEKKFPVIVTVQDGKTDIFFIS